jgi:hypothetical protein
MLGFQNVNIASERGIGGSPGDAREMFEGSPEAPGGAGTRGRVPAAGRESFLKKSV